MNQVIQLGRLTRDPELRYTQGGTPVLNCCIATNRSVPKGDGEFEDEATFVDFTMWGKRAEAFAKYHKKGSLAHLVGRLTLHTWADTATGKSRSKLIMTAESFEFVGAKSSDEEQPF